MHKVGRLHACLNNRGHLNLESNHYSLDHGHGTLSLSRLHVCTPDTQSFSFLDLGNNAFRSPKPLYQIPIRWPVTNDQWPVRHSVLLQRAEESEIHEDPKASSSPLPNAQSLSWEWLGGKEGSWKVHIIPKSINFLWKFFTLLNRTKLTGFGPTLSPKAMKVFLKNDRLVIKDNCTSQCSVSICTTQSQMFRAFAEWGLLVGCGDPMGVQKMNKEKGSLIQSFCERSVLSPSWVVGMMHTQWCLPILAPGGFRWRTTPHSPTIIMSPSFFTDMTGRAIALFSSWRGL